MRIGEKELREEVINRCVEFLDVAIHLILYIEQIYSNDLFEKRLKYQQIVYECQDLEVQSYISDFLNQIKPFIQQQILDQIGLVITSRDERHILRRYLLEIHPIVEQSSSKIHSNGKEFFVELDSIFSTCLIELIRQNPISPLNFEGDEHENEELRWRLQIRACQNGNFEQFQLTDVITLSLKQIKSVHSQRLNIQIMCQNRNKKEEHASDKHNRKTK